MVGNFRGVQIFVDFVRSVVHKNLLNFSSVRGDMPRKYKPTKSSELPKPQKISPTKITNRKIVKFQHFSISTSHRYESCMVIDVFCIPTKANNALILTLIVWPD